MLEEPVEPGHARVVQTRERARFGLEAIDEVGLIQQFGAQQFDRHLAARHLVDRGVDGAHAAVPEQTLERELPDR